MMVAPRHVAVCGCGLAAVVGIAAAGWRATDDAAVEFTESEVRRILRLSPPGGPGPPPPDETNQYAEVDAASHLGRYLFFETRFSTNGQIGCVTCHQPALAFTDGKQLAQGLGDVARHSPTLLNVAYSRWFFWDGRADSLWSQALEPIEAANEMGGNRMRCAHLVHDDRQLRAAYTAIFGPMPDLTDEARFPPDAREVPRDRTHPHHLAWIAMTADDRQAVNRVYANLGKAIAAYVRRLISNDSPFDRFVSGLRDGDRERLAAISPAAKRGLKLFVGRANCTLCHMGPNFTDGEFHNIAIPPLNGQLPVDSGRYRGIEKLKRSEFKASGIYSDAPAGRAARRTASLANGPDNWGNFKTPSLRNVARTAPYMSQGQFATLGEVLHYYSTLENAVQLDHHQEQVLTPLEFTDQETTDLLAFLESLTGASIPVELTSQPKSPISDR